MCSHVKGQNDGAGGQIQCAVEPVAQFIACYRMDMVLVEPRHLRFKCLGAHFKRATVHPIKIAMIFQRRDGLRGALFFEIDQPLFFVIRERLLLCPRGRIGILCRGGGEGWRQSRRGCKCRGGRERGRLSCGYRDWCGLRAGREQEGGNHEKRDDFFHGTHCIIAFWALRRLCAGKRNNQRGYN